MLHAKPVNSSMSPTANLSLFKSDPFSDPILYRSTVGSLQYLSFTRPDLAFIVSKVCQFMQGPTIDHWTAVKRILHYLQQTIHHGIFIRRTSSTDIHAFSDTDWAGCPDDKRSVSGYCLYLGSNLISWSSRKQPTVSRYSMEAEYRVVTNTTAEVMWLQSLLTELGIFSPTPPTLWCDNIGAMYLTANPLYHSRTKHIELDIHFVRDQVAQRHLQVRFISGTDQIADSFTKALPTARSAVSVTISMFMSSHCD
jgi:histone deacetylase 1/2